MQNKLTLPSLQDIKLFHHHFWDFYFDFLSFYSNHHQKKVSEWWCCYELAALSSIPHPRAPPRLSADSRQLWPCLPKPDLELWIGTHMSVVTGLPQLPVLSHFLRPLLCWRTCRYWEGAISKLPAPWQGSESPGEDELTQLHPAAGCTDCWTQSVLRPLKRGKASFFKSWKGKKAFEKYIPL